LEIYNIRISVPEEAPFSACIKFVAEHVILIKHYRRINTTFFKIINLRNKKLFMILQFKVNHATSAIITNSGVGINPE